MANRLAINTITLLLTLFIAHANASARDNPHAQKALEIYKTLIAWRTAKGYGQVPEMANYLASEFKAGGFPEKDIHVLPMNDTAGLVVRYRGNGSSGKKPILLSAHMDVLDAAPEQWQSDPFTLSERDGYFYGRGSSDNKHGVTALTSTFLRLKAEGYVPNRDLIIIFSGDEASGAKTTREMVTTWRDLTDAEFALVADGGGGSLDEQGNPVHYYLQMAEKTYVVFELTATNPGGHGSVPRKDNAIYDLANALQKISALTFPVNYNDLTREFLRLSAKWATPKDAKAMRQFAKDPTDKQAINTLRENPSLAAILGTTCVATMLQAGQAENELPLSASAKVNCRVFPGESVATTLDQLKRAVANDSITWRELTEATGVPASPANQQVINAVTAAIKLRYPGVDILPYMSPYATDGRAFRTNGIPSYAIHGLFLKPDEAIAESVDERLPVRSFFEDLDYWHTVLTELTK